MRYNGIEACDHYVVAFLNSAFKHTIPAESKIESLRIEMNGQTRVTTDYFLKAIEPDGMMHYFHAETQVKNYNRMSVADSAELADLPISEVEAIVEN